MNDDPLLTIPVPFRDWLASKAMLGTLKANTAADPADSASFPWRVPSGNYALADLMIEVRGGPDVPATLRDYYAGEWVQVIIGGGSFLKGVGNDPAKAHASMREIVTNAYNAADRMVEARKKRR
jgi:hypothetical protein